MSIELKNVTYTYSPGTAYEIHALKDINLSIPDGQFIGIIGHTGSGKSTLIQHLNARLVLYFSIRSISSLRMMCFLMYALVP